MSASGNSSASSGSKNNSTRPSRRFWEEDADDDPSTKLPEISEDTAVYLTTQRKTHGTVSYGGSRSLSGVSGRDPEREFKERVERQRRVRMTPQRAHCIDIHLVAPMLAAPRDRRT